MKSLQKEIAVLTRECDSLQQETNVLHEQVGDAEQRAQALENELMEVRKALLLKDHELTDAMKNFQWEKAAQQLALERVTVQLDAMEEELSRHRSSETSPIGAPEKVREKKGGCDVNMK